VRRAVGEKDQEVTCNHWHELLDDFLMFRKPQGTPTPVRATTNASLLSFAGRKGAHACVMQVSCLATSTDTSTPQPIQHHQPLAYPETWEWVWSVHGILRYEHRADRGGERELPPGSSA
jgi:hypothetical protein